MAHKIFGDDLNKNGKCFYPNCKNYCIKSTVSKRDLQKNSKWKIENWKMWQLYLGMEKFGKL